MSEYLLPSISNGNQIEQALIRKWWYINHQGRGLLIWEYYMLGNYIDAVWFPNSTDSKELYGKGISKLYPLSGHEVVLLEAKGKLSHGLIGQGLVYKVLAERAGAIIQDVCIFAQSGTETMEFAARTLGLSVVVAPL
ncbi:MAG: hypothetical protein KA586_02475 [Candidatus Promineofilum sp.]|nr:hypothetical protein [Promineifilum sp.]